MKVTVKMPKGFEKATKESVARALSALATFAKDRITVAAQTKLHSTASTYIRGISEPKLTATTATITLVGRLPNMMEGGTSAFDLKRGLLKGRRFVDVPFRHGAPGSVVFKEMPVTEHSLMRAAVKAAGGAVRVRGPASMPTGPRAGHKRGIYDDMVAQRHRYEKGVGTTYTTWRRLSITSDPSSWIHPGFKPLHLFPGVANEVRKLAPRLLREYIKQGIK